MERIADQDRTVLDTRASHWFQSVFERRLKSLGIAKNPQNSIRDLDLEELGIILIKYTPVVLYMADPQRLELLIGPSADSKYTEGDHLTITQEYGVSSDENFAKPGMLIISEKTNRIVVIDGLHTLLRSVGVQEKASYGRKILDLIARYRIQTLYSTITTGNAQVDSNFVFTNVDPRRRGIINAWVRMLTNRTKLSVSERLLLRHGIVPPDDQDIK